MSVQRIGEILALNRQGERPYLEFLRKESMSVGVYVLPAGATDPQQPHAEDEVYVVLAGKAQVTIGDEDHPLGPGHVIFVEKRVEHRFHSIEEELQLLVFFAPAES